MARKTSSIVTKDREAKANRRDRIQRELERIQPMLEALDAERVILFGSAASGDIGRASDIDLIVVKRTDKRFLDRLDEVYEALEPRVGTDILVYTPEEFERLKEDRAFVRRAVAEGKVLYERSAEDAAASEEGTAE